MKRKVIYIQDDINSCGSVCIQSIVSFYGGYVPLEKVLEDTNTGNVGTNAYEIVRTLRKYGFLSYGKKIGLDSIKKDELPTIAHVIKNGLEHFVVIYEIGDEKILTMDPEYGKKEYSWTYFKEIYDEKAIFIFKEGEVPKYRPKTTFFKFFMPFIKENRSNLLILAGMNLLILILSLFLSLHLKLMDMMTNPFKLTIIFLMIRLSVFIVSLLKDNLIENINEKIDLDMIPSFTKHIFNLRRACLKRKKTGQIINRIREMSSIKEFILRLSMINSLDLIMIVASQVIMISIDKTLSTIYIFLTIAIIVMNYLFTKKLYKQNKESIQLYDNYAGSLVEYINGIESIKNLNKEDYFLEKLELSLKEFTSYRKTLNKFFNFHLNSKNYIFETGVLISNIVGFLNISETFTFLDLITMQTLFSLFYSSLESILNSTEHLTKCKAMYKTISEFLDLETEGGEKSGNISFKNLKIDRLTYSYDNFHDNVKNFSYMIERGDKILIQGPSGIGKSTLVKCLCGILNNYKGHILLNGEDITFLNTSHLRDYITYIGQEETLFQDSISNNITLGSRDDELLSHIVSICKAGDLISKRKDGLNAIVLEGATNLSGGERARLILARALYRQTPLLIIDETLSSVSEEMEDEIIKNLLREWKLTVIYITHRNKDHLFKKSIKFRKDHSYEIK